MWMGHRRLVALRFLLRSKWAVGERVSCNDGDPPPRRVLWILRARRVGVDILAPRAAVINGVARLFRYVVCTMPGGADD